MTADSFLAAIADFERLPIPGGVLELDGTVAAVNHAATVLLARPRSQLLGRKAWDFAPGAEHIWSVAIGAASQTDYRGEIAIATPLGPRTVQYVVSLRSHDGRTVALMFAVEVKDAEDEGKQRLESLGLVAGGIAHDFNNQLVSVLAEATATREDPTLGERVRDSLRRIETAAQRMALLTRQLLAYAGRGRIVTEPIDPDELVGELQEQLQRIVRPEAQLLISLGSVRIAVEADRALLREAIVNLVVNASEALPDRGGKINLSTGLDARDSITWWRLEVSDDGVGMDPRMVARIFDPFFTTKADRHGLGLSAVHGIVRRLGGDISVHSEPGHGTRIQVRLPVVGGVRPKTRSSGSSPPRPLSLRGMAILVADDEPSVRATVRRLLERRGANVVIAADGEEAAARLGEAAYSLVVLDVMMPKLTGYQLLPLARKLQPSARVMLMSGYSDASRGSSGEEPDVFLEKPFTAKQMDDAIDGLLAR